MPAEHQPRPGRSSRTVGTVGAAVALVLVAVNLRPAIVAVGPLAGAIEADTGLTSSLTGLLTTLPVLCLGVFAAVAPAVARRVGFDRAVLVAVLLVMAGIAVRLLMPVSALFAGTVVAGCGIALGNVLVPALVKRDFPQRIGPMMSVYSLALQGGAALSSGITLPVGSLLGVGWRTSLALWGVPAVVALVCWLPRAVRGPSATTDEQGTRYAVWHSRLGWAAAAFIGLQSAVYFSLTAWMPSLLQSHGMSADRAGLMLLLLGVAGILGGLPMPLLAARMDNQRMLVAFVVGTFLVGLLGLLLDPVPLVVVWAVMLGLGQGSGLSLALTLFTLRSRTVEAAAQLSSMGQTVGYLIAATGPFVVGALHALTGGWTVPVVVLLVVLAPLLVTGWAAARPRYLEDEVRTA